MLDENAGTTLFYQSPDYFDHLAKFGDRAFLAIIDGDFDSPIGIVPLRKSDRAPIRADVGGPVCETGDFLARDRQVADAVPGDLLAVCTAGAYGFTLSSNYNSRPRSPEILVSGGQWRTIRTRETLEDLVRGEQP